MTTMVRKAARLHDYNFYNFQNTVQSRHYCLPHEQRPFLFPAPS